jgi:hypothetical protein
MVAQIVSVSEFRTGSTSICIKYLRQVTFLLLFSINKAAVQI